MKGLLQVLEKTNFYFEEYGRQDCLDMSATQTSNSVVIELPRVQLSYEDFDMALTNRNRYVEFAGMRSYTTLTKSNLRVPVNSFRRSMSNTHAMKCREFSFDEMSTKPKTVGFRKGKVVENKQLFKLDTEDSFFEESTSRLDTSLRKSEDFSVEGQKVNLKLSDSPAGSKAVPPREWNIEKSRTLPNINECLNGNPVTLYRPLQQNLEPEKLNVSLESLTSVGKDENKETEPDKTKVMDSKEMQSSETQIKNENSVALPKIEDTPTETPPAIGIKGITVSLQTDDYLFQKDDSERPTTRQNSRKGRYRPIKILTPRMMTDLPDLHESNKGRSTTPKRDTPRIARKAFPTLRPQRQPISSSTATAASANRLGKLSTSLPLLPQPKRK